MVNVAITAFVQFLATGCRAFAGIYLARHLPIEDFAVFGVVLTLMQIGAFVTLFGQSQGAVRRFSRTPLGRYRWMPFYGLVWTGSWALTLSLAALAYWLYGLPAGVAALMAAIIGCRSGLELIASLFRASKLYLLAVTAQQMVPILFAAAVLLAFRMDVRPGVPGILMIYLAVAAANLAMYSIWLARRMERGGEPLGWSLIRDGFWLFTLEIAFVLFAYVDRLALPAMVDNHGFATYFAILQLAYAYDITSQTVQFVMAPALGGRVRIPVLRRYGALAAVSAAAITAGYGLFGEWGLNWIYNGKYDHGLRLLPIICVTGICRVLYSLPACIVLAVAGEDATRKFSLFSWFTLGVYVLVLPPMVMHFGLEGAAWSGAMVWTLRLAGGCAFGLSLYRLDLKNENQVPLGESLNA